MLSIFNKNSHFSPIDVIGMTISTSQLTDNIAIFRKHSTEVRKILQLIDTFSKASVLKLNLNKRELTSVHQTPLTEAHGIPIYPL